MLSVWRSLNSLRQVAQVRPADVAGRELSRYEMHLLGEIEREMTDKDDDGD